MEYFRMSEGSGHDERGWVLGEPQDSEEEVIDAQLFTTGIPFFDRTELTIPIEEQGDSLDFNLLSFQVPIVSKKAAVAIQEIANDEIQFVPVSLSTGEVFYILNLLKSIDCLDYTRSILTYFPMSEQLIPGAAGTPNAAVELYIHPDKVAGHDIFRLKELRLPIIVSRNLLNALESVGVTGFEVEKVT